MDDLLQLLVEKGYTISSCESLTAGLFAARLAEIPGASKALKGGLVTYCNDIKEKLAGVSSKTVKEYGVISEQTAREMALGVQKACESDVAVSFTGNAGPDVMENKPAGLVYTCIVIKERIYPFEDLIKMERNELRNRITELTAKRVSELLRNE